MILKNTENQRKKLKRYDLPGHAHELTFSCYHSYPYLSDPTVCRIFLDDLERARNMLFFKIWAYVLMLNHVHLLIWPYKSDYKIASILQAIKGRTSKRYKDILKDTNPDMLSQLLINQNGLKRFHFCLNHGLKAVPHGISIIFSMRDETATRPMIHSTNEDALILGPS